MKVIAPFIACVVDASPADEADTLATALAEGYQQIYIRTEKGFMKHHVLRPGKDGMARYIRVPVTEVPGLKYHSYAPDVQFLPAGKVPIKLLEEVKGFFREVIKKKGTAVEAMIWVLWSQERGYYLHVPNQVVSKASANYDWASLPAGSSIIVDIHSHADFNAFFSGTDDRDDANTIRFSGVIGHNDKPTPSTKWRFNYLGMKIDVEFDAIFEPEQVQVDVPDIWMDAVKTQSETYKGKTGGYPIGGYQGGYSGGPGVIYPTTHYARRMAEEAKGSNPENTISASTQAAIDAASGRVNRRYGHLLENDSVSDGNFADGGHFGKGKNKGSKKKHFGEQQTTSATQKSDCSLETQRGFDDEGWLSTMGGMSDDQYYGMYGSTSDPISRMHNAAARQAQEDLLSEQAEEHLAQMCHTYEVKGEIITALDIPPEFDDLAISHGVDVARAYSLIDKASADLIGCESVLKKSIEDLFMLVDEDVQLAVFKGLAELLPPKARQSLETNGL